MKHIPREEINSNYIRTKSFRSSKKIVVFQMKPWEKWNQGTKKFDVGQNCSLFSSMTKKGKSLPLLFGLQQPLPEELASGLLRSLRLCFLRLLLFRLRSRWWCWRWRLNVLWDFQGRFDKKNWNTINKFITSNKIQKKCYIFIFINIYEMGLFGFTNALESRTKKMSF